MRVQPIPAVSRHLGTRVWSPVFIALLAVTSLPAQASATPESPGAPYKELMGKLADAFTDLERALVAKDAAQVARTAETIANASKGVATWSVHGNANSEETKLFRALAAHLPATAAAIGAAATAGDLPGAGTAVQHLRRSCVACHVQFRDTDDERRPFPAKGSTIWGRITLKSPAESAQKSAGDAIAFIDHAAEITAPSFEVATPRISQKGKQFTPRVLPIVRRQAVDFPNDDTIFHNVFSLSKAHPFDLGVYGKGESRRVGFDNTGLVRVYCNIHADMTCSILVLQNPYFAVTDDTGIFVITDVPAGDYMLRCWHTLSTGDSKEVSVGRSTTVRVDFALDENLRVVKHRNKFGQRYSKKY